MKKCKPFVGTDTENVFASFPGKFFLQSNLQDKQILFLYRKFSIFNFPMSNGSYNSNYNILH